MVADLFELPPTRVYAIVDQLKETGMLAEVENGKYLVLGFEPERVLANLLYIAAQLVSPGFVTLKPRKFFGYQREHRQPV